MVVRIEAENPKEILELVGGDRYAEARYQAMAMLHMLNYQRMLAGQPPVQSLDMAMHQPMLPPQQPPAYMLPPASPMTYAAPAQEWQPQFLAPLPPQQTLEVYPQQPPTVIEQPETVLASAEVPTKRRWGFPWGLLYLLPPMIAVWFIFGYLKVNMAANMMQPPEQPEAQEQAAPAEQPPTDQRSLIELLKPAIPQ